MDPTTLEEAEAAANAEIATRSMLAEAAALLSERITGAVWSHNHCDTTSDGTHRLDYEWWEEDAERLVERIKQAINKEKV